jgi:hypothetical protein
MELRWNLLLVILRSCLSFLDSRVRVSSQLAIYSRKAWKGMSLCSGIRLYNLNLTTSQIPLTKLKYFNQIGYRIRNHLIKSHY